MEIQQTKQNLEITVVAEQLGIKIDARSKRNLSPILFSLAEIEGCG